MSKRNKNNLVILVSLVALLTGFAFVVHHAMMPLSGCTFCLSSFCAFIPSFFALLLLLGHSITFVHYRPILGVEIPFLPEKPPKS
jgi:hypothetical protein